MKKNELIQITKDENGRELVMVRCDKNLKEMMEEKPFSRWDANYWHPKWDKLIQELRLSPIKTIYLGDVFPDDNWLIATDHVRASKGEKEGDQYSVEYYSPAGLLFTGYDTSRIPHCTDNAFRRMERARPLQFDVLLGGFGMGPTGKSVVLWHKPASKAIVGNIFILRTKSHYSPIVLEVFFKTYFGQAQFYKYKTGVAFNSLSNDEIRYLLVPLFSPKQIEEIESKFQDVISLHDKAMKSKMNKDDLKYTEQIKDAEKKFKELISITEGMIRTPSKDA